MTYNLIYTSLFLPLFSSYNDSQTRLADLQTSKEIDSTPSDVLLVPNLSLSTPKSNQYDSTSMGNLLVHLYTLFVNLFTQTYIYNRSS